MLNIIPVLKDMSHVFYIFMLYGYCRSGINVYYIHETQQNKIAVK
jgi:hypothetical protein